MNVDAWGLCIPGAFIMLCGIGMLFFPRKTDADPPLSIKIVVILLGLVILTAGIYKLPAPRPSGSHVFLNERMVT